MTSISFTGDIAFSKYFKDSWKEKFLDEKIVGFLKDSDHVVANVEAPLTATSVSSDRPINHFCAPESAKWFKEEIFADIWTIGNNHILDCAEAGMLDTIAAAKENGAVTVGAGMNADEAGRPVVIDSEGGIGIFAVTYKRGEFIRAGETNSGCILFDEPARIKSIIEEIKSKNRWCVVVAHGGDEFAHLPMPYIRKLYRSFLKMGADVVVGHHPHVVEGYEKHGKKMIFYSLGNFVFDTDYQRIQKHSENGILLKLSFGEDDFSWDYMATKVNRELQTVDASQAPIIFREIDEKVYKKLWPLAASDLAKNLIAARKFAIPKTRNYNCFQWFEFNRKKIGLKDTLCFYYGRFISCFGFWKKVQDEELKDYFK